MRFAFISGMSGHPWGGSEELWSRAALRLHQEGHAVWASVHGWPETPERVARMRAAGITMRERRYVPPSLPARLVARVLRQNLSARRQALMYQELVDFQPDLVCVSHGSIGCGLEWMEFCQANRLRYVSIAQANSESFWPPDDYAERLQVAYQGAEIAGFVSEGNRRLFELQVGARLSNTQIVHNPFGVPYDVPLPWPGDGPVWKLACVARLEPSAKGQDLLLQVLSREEWKDRPLEVTFFGKGPMEQSLKRLARELGVDGKVRFAGHVAEIQQVWTQHHALVLPSRFEGLPLALVEAMLCGRPAIVTDVAGNAELVGKNGECGFVATAPTVTAVADAMERAWESRMRWQAMGQTASHQVRAQIPRDPIGEFCRKLEAVIRVRP
ncbi:glycosyltransferase family 4 protein [Verrucomicrobiota bacterium sgz303538]